MTEVHMTLALNVRNTTRQGGGQSQISHTTQQTLPLLLSHLIRGQPRKYTGIMQAKTREPEQRHAETIAHWLNHPQKVS